MKLNTTTISRISLFSVIVITLLSCSPKVDNEEFAAEIRTTFSAKDSTAKKSYRNIAAGVYSVYSSNGFQPVWFDDRGLSKKADKLIEELEALPNEGIPISSFHIQELKKEVEENSKKAGNKDIKKLVSLDKELTTVYVQAASTVLYGVLDPEDVVDMWYHTNDTTVLWSAAVADNKFPSLDMFRSNLPAYKELIERRKSATAGDSSLAVIDANLERLRWLPQQLEETHVLVVVPSMQMKLVENGKTTMEMKTVVGKPDRETPSLNSDMKHVVLNPSWGVPPGIMKKDVIPGLLNKGEGYLAKKGLKVYDRNGDEVDPGKINNENYKGYVFRQDPGERNALGQVKFDMPNPWAIYLHDTPNKDDFGKDDRYKSSGCVRLEKALVLADHILNEMNTKNDTVAVDSITKENKTKYVKLQKPIPVHIVYLTAYDMGNGLQFYRDIYNKDAELAALLSRQK